MKNRHVNSCSPDLSVGGKGGDDALIAQQAALHPHLRNCVTPHIGADKAIKSMEEFEALRFMRAENLTAAQRQSMIAIRNAIPNPVTGTPMQRVIKGTEIDSFIGQNRNITGFVAKQEDARSEVFHNTEEMVEGLRLDYDGGFQGQTSVGLVEWDFAPGTSFEVTRSTALGSTVNDPYPYVGDGFSATKSGRLVPEYRVPGSVTPPEGAKLLQLNQDGTKVLRATYQGGFWVANP